MNTGWKLNRTSLSKYHGLLKIEMHNLNHPQWVFVSTPRRIPAQPWADAPVGWTVRCCSEKSYEFGLPSEHMLQFTEIRSVIRGFLKRLETKVRFVIYPSWEFDISGCCLMGYNHLTVEAVKGDIAPLLRGQSRPGCCFGIGGSSFQSFDLVRGCRELLSIQDQQVLIVSCRKLKFTFSTIVLEWTKTLCGEILFHDWLELR